MKLACKILFIDMKCTECLVKKCFVYKSAQMSNFSQYSKSFSSFQEGFHYLALVVSMKLKKFSYAKDPFKIFRVFVYFLQNKKQVFKKFRLHSRGLFFKNGCRFFFVFSKWVILFFVCSFQYNNDSILFLKIVTHLVTTR